MKEPIKIKGYKSFAFNYTNQAGEVMEEGHTYHCDGPIKYNKNGYHMALHFEDTIAFSDTVDENGQPKRLHDVIIAEVIGSGEIDKVDPSYSDYYDYWDMFACSDMEIVRFVPRLELIKKALNLDSKRMKRFVSNTKLSDYEISLFRDVNPEVDLAIQYYQEGNEEAYSTENINKVYENYYRKIRR